MRVEREIINAAILNKTFNLSKLWVMREYLSGLRKNLEFLKESFISKSELKNASEVEVKIYYVDANFLIVESAIDAKESEIFQTTEFSEYCLN